ncbi:shikimate dehydrogenase [Ginsengibacter hankyongi]|uniref:Shikimate dehydrogenase n=1 Tax=Ginsengibacter hankyongi TaxID=2607284 RepID=A0A5J5IJU0_9BACT|nr:shikimate dehydrogenase [Ginsengibacter hankyongi]KAA9041335.1 shikimate dehydrogenase [Ginsengibacter hankyongi]
MKIYGLIGNPLSHSFSKKYFTEKFSRENITGCQYQNFEIKNLQKEIPALKNNPLLSGLNVTIPYKSDIITFLDTISAECSEINACNCIKIHNGKWSGFNTDVTGFEKSFVPYLQPHHKKALILGTGGSSKAVAYVLKKKGIEFLFVSRRNDVSSGVINYESISSLLMQEYSIIINTTPVGMFPNVEECPPLPYEYISDKHYFFDLVYNPPKTVFLSKAEAMGAVIKNGSDMLSIQAEESWKIWNNLK